MRPVLSRDLSPEDFQNYYWLKEELFIFCRSCSIARNGSKKELAARIAHYLRTGNVLSVPKARVPLSRTGATALSLDSVIPDGYRNDENHRAFFKSVIGDHFSFNVPFMTWMKANAGKTYSVAVSEWLRIAEEKKAGKKTEIPSQFEYNQYTRDFFEANPDLKKADAIKCWKYKRDLPGNCKYELGDLKAIRPATRKNQHSKVKA